MNYWKALSLAMYLLGWFSRASADGKITADELAEAIKGAIGQLGLDIEIDVPPPTA